jgi:hypothetical protein
MIRLDGADDLLQKQRNCCSLVVVPLPRDAPPRDRPKWPSNLAPLSPCGSCTNHASSGVPRDVPPPARLVPPWTEAAEQHMGKRREWVGIATRGGAEDIRTEAATGASALLVHLSLFISLHAYPCARLVVTASEPKAPLARRAPRLIVPWRCSFAGLTTAIIVTC